MPFISGQFARLKKALRDAWTNWGTYPGMVAREALHTRIINQISMLALGLAVIRLIVFVLLRDWNAVITAFPSAIWILPLWLNKIGASKLASLAFLFAYPFVFLSFTLLTSESAGHWSVFFIIAAAFIFYGDSTFFRVFSVVGLLLFIGCVVWIQNVPPISDLKFPLLNSVMRGISIGFTLLLLVILLVHELQVSEEKANSEKERLGAVLQGALDAVITIDKHSIVVEWNSQAVFIFGYAEAEAKGKFLQNLIIPDEYRRAHAQGMKHYLDTGEGPLLNARIEIKAKRKNGEIFPLELTVIPVINSGKQFFTAFARDITEKKTAEKKLLLLNAELHQFASVASHDLKEPLRNIEAFSDLLLEETPQSMDAQEYISFIKDATRRMATLLDDLIAFARAGGDTGELHGIDLNQVLNAALSNLALKMEETGTEIHAGKLPVVMGGNTHYLQLFQNLLANAIKFQPPGSKPVIHIWAKQELPFWKISFRDNGIGIPPERLEDIFKPFQRFHEYEGSGIGLATCRKIANNYGGRIWAESALGEGSVFYILLPAATEE